GAGQWIARRDPDGGEDARARALRSRVPEPLVTVAGREDHLQNGLGRPARSQRVLTLSNRRATPGLPVFLRVAAACARSGCYVRAQAIVRAYFTTPITVTARAATPITLIQTRVEFRRQHRIIIRHGGQFSTARRTAGGAERNKLEWRDGINTRAGHERG